MVTAAEKREEGNELFRAGQHAAAAAAYGEAIGLVAHEVGALAMAAGGPDDDGDPAAAQEPGLGMVPSKLKETCVACHANRAAIRIHPRAHAAANAAASSAPNRGVPSPVTGSHPRVQLKPKRSGAPNQLTALLPFTTSRKPPAPQATR